MENVTKAKIEGEATAEMLDELTGNNIPITVAEVKKATGFGDSGSVLVAELANADGMTFSQAKNAVETAYLAGFTGLDESKATFATDTQRLAFRAGSEDRRVQNNANAEKAQSASVYENGFTENEYSAKLTPAEREVFTFLAKDLKMDTEIVDKLIAARVNGIEYEADGQHQDGRMRVSSTANSMLGAGFHEALHRVKQLDPEAFGALSDFIYNHTDKSSILYEQIKAEHDSANIAMESDDVIEEVVIRQLENFATNPESLIEWRKSLDANPVAKSGWQKFCEALKTFLEDVWAAITNSKMSLDAKRQAQAEIDEARRLLDNAYKGAMQAAEGRAKEIQQNSEVQTQENTDEEISTSRNFSLKIDSSGVSKNDIDRLRSIGRKPISKFTPEDIKKAEPFARILWNDLKEKSPFFRAWFGDWRKNDGTPVNVVSAMSDTRGLHKNNDTGWEINRSAKVQNEKHDSRASISGRMFLPYIDGIIENAILLNSEISDNENENSLMFHSLYAVVNDGNNKGVIKLMVEELKNPGKSIERRAYKLVDIEKLSTVGAGGSLSLTSSRTIDSINNISQLFEFVKTYDKEFNPKPSSVVVDENENVETIVDEGLTDASEHGKIESSNTKTEAEQDEFTGEPDTGREMAGEDSEEERLHRQRNIKRNNDAKADSKGRQGTDLSADGRENGDNNRLTKKRRYFWQ